MKLYRPTQRAVRLACVSGVAAMLPALSPAQEAMQLEEIVVSGSRLSTSSLDTFPGTVTVVDAAAIQTQREFSTDMGDLLAATVPSLGTSSFMGSNRDQTLRGRKPVVLIDGVPVSTPLRDGDAEVRSIDASVVEQIEVIHGSTSLYGNGGAGGSINYITRRARPGELTSRLEASIAGSLTNFSDSESLAARGVVSGGGDRLSFILGAGYEDNGYQFDADGDRIAPTNGGTISGVAASEVKSGFGKLSLTIDDDRRLEAMANYYKQTQDTPYRIVAGDIARGIKASTEKTGRDPREILVPGNESSLFSVSFIDQAVLGGYFAAQAYYLDYQNTYGLSPAFPSVDRPSQSINKNRKYGARTDFSTPIGERTRLLWGADYANDKTSQPLADGRTWTPPMELTSIAVFAQADTKLGERWTVRGGVRYEENDLDVDTYTTFREVTATGGTLDFNATTWNLGGSYQLTDALDLFAGYSQGSSVGEIGRVLRDIRTNTSVATINPRAVIVDTYELGIRGTWSSFDFELVGFINESEYGIQLQQDPSNPLLTIATQEDERIEGVEFTMGYVPAAAWRLAFAASWQDGERDANHDGSLDTNLDNVRIAPLKLTASVDYEVNERWHLRVQGTHSGSRDPFPGQTGNNTLNLGKNEAFTVIDLLAAVKLGTGKLSLGVLNLFNEDYFPRWSQSQNRNDRYTAAPGATAKVTYSIEF